MAFRHQVDLVLELIDQKTEGALVSGLCQFNLDGHDINPSKVIEHFYVFTNLRQKLGRPLESFSFLEVAHDSYLSVQLGIPQMVEKSDNGVFLQRLQPSRSYPFKRRPTLVSGQVLKPCALFYVNEEDLLMNHVKIMLTKDVGLGEALELTQSRDRALGGRILLLEQEAQREVVTLYKRENGIGQDPLKHSFKAFAQVRELIPVKVDASGSFEIAFELAVESTALTLVMVTEAGIQTQELTLKKGDKSIAPTLLGQDTL